jgi:hypothetical protein
MKKFILLLTCSLLTSFLGLTAQAESEQAAGEIAAGKTVDTQIGESSSKLEEQKPEQTRSALTQNGTEKNTELSEKPAAQTKESVEKPATAPQKEFRKLSSRELVAQYIASGLFGALTGTGCHFVEKHNIIELNRPWSWMLEYVLRTNVMRTLEEDMKNNRNVALAPGACTFAWASSWMAYLTAKCVA